jgi:hypothetical protein
MPVDRRRRRGGGTRLLNCAKLKIKCRRRFATASNRRASHKLSLRVLSGGHCRVLQREAQVAYKSAFGLLHALREAMADELKGRVVGGAGKVAEADGGYFGGYVKPANQKEYRRDRRYARNQNGKRKVVVIVLERGGNSVPAVFGPESQASAFIRARIAKRTVVHADEASSWDGLHERFEMKRINHKSAYRVDGACTNMAEEYFSRLRLAEIGVHHHIAGVYLLRQMSLRGAGSARFVSRDARKKTARRRSVSVCREDPPAQTQRTAALEDLRYPRIPIPKKPKIIIAQVDASGTAATLKLAVSKASCAGLFAKLAERIDSPGLVTNCTYCENAWLPSVVENPRLFTEKS